MTFDQFVAKIESVIGVKTTALQGISNIARIMDNIIFLSGPNLERFDGSRRYSFCSRLSFSPTTHLFFCVDFGQFSSQLGEAVRKLDPTRINNCKMVIDDDGLFISTSGEINSGVYRFNQQSDVRISAETFIYYTNGDSNTTAEVIDWIKARLGGGMMRKIDTSGNLIQPRLQSSAQHPLNQILYGPPGTGKTYNAINHALAIVKGVDVKNLIEEQRLDDTARKRHKLEFDKYIQEGQIRLVTFHQSYSYEEFIEGIKPVVNENGGIEYKIVDGVFKQICNEAGRKKIGGSQNIDSAEKNFVLIIDEINRGNISKIFGELITLLEDSKRIGALEEIRLRLAYSGVDEGTEAFGVPQNVYVLGTMNSTDRSIALIDTALRRRFSFTEYSPNSSLLTKVDQIDLSALIETINARIEYLLDRDHLIGHAYFMNVKSKNDLCAIFRNKIIPLLQEYFYNDYEKIGHVLGDNKLWKKQDHLRIIKEKSLDKIERLFGGEIDGYDGKVIYGIIEALEREDYESIDSSVFISIYEQLPVLNES